MVDERLPAVTPKGRATRESLLDAGEAVAERDGAQGLTVTAITAQAGLAKGTFYVHFSDRASFVEALQARFREHVEDAILSAIEPHEPGRAFLAAVIDGYLDACLAHRAVKAVLIDTRPSEGSRDMYVASTRRFENLIEPSLTRIGMTPVDVHTRILIAVASEAALFALEDGADPDGVRTAAKTWLGLPSSLEGMT